jgi:hypothetical protein
MFLAPGNAARDGASLDRRITSPLASHAAEDGGAAAKIRMAHTASILKTKKNDLGLIANLRCPKI